MTDEISGDQEPNADHPNADTTSEVAQTPDAQAAGVDDSDAPAAAEDAGDAPEFKVDVPKGGDAYASDVEAFQTDMSQWLADNSEATPAQALQEAVNRQARVVTEAVKAQEEQAAQAFETQVAEWEGQAKADPEIGGDKFEENVSVAMKALEAYGSPDLTAVLNDSGLGSHPEVIRFMIKAGRALADASVVPGTTKISDGDPLADRYRTPAK